MGIKCPAAAELKLQCCRLLKRVTCGYDRVQVTQEDWQTTDNEWLADAAYILSYLKFNIAYWSIVYSDNVRQQAPCSYELNKTSK